MGHLRLWSISAGLVVGACSNTQPANTMVVANDTASVTNEAIPAWADNSVTPSAPTAPVVPPHNYGFKEGGVYGYISAVSENDKKAGKAVGSVVLYRYGGMTGGKYTLFQVSDSGVIISRDECTNPCVAIKSFSSGGMERIPYNAGSVVGAAFDDAFAGYLTKGRVLAESREVVAAPAAPAVDADVMQNGDGTTQ